MSRDTNEIIDAWRGAKWFEVVGPKCHFAFRAENGSANEFTSTRRHPGLKFTEITMARVEEIIATVLQGSALWHTPDYTTDANLVQPMLDQCEELQVEWSQIGASRVGWSVGLNWADDSTERHTVWVGPLPTLSEALTSAIVAMIEATSKGETDGMG